MSTTTLYRPVGIKELELILAAGNKVFPPRLSWQPIFYPVLNQSYAEQIALTWNTQDDFSGYCGIVTQFEVYTTHLQQYTVQEVGGVVHQELWVPAGALPAFNQQIAGTIHIVKVFFGDQFVMPESRLLKQELSKFKDDAL